MNHKNPYGQPIGYPVEDWQESAFPPRSTMIGKWCRVESLVPEKHAEELFAAYVKKRNDQDWTYLPYGPFESFDDYQSWLTKTCTGDDPLFHTITETETNKAVGVASFLRIQFGIGVIEVGHIHFSPLLQKTPVATEAMFLMMSRVFDELCYRRYEWKCDALNAPSRKAAERFGFSFEGLFRQATLYKNRNRDTAWFGMTDREWPMIKKTFEIWLSPDNFDTQGRQKKNLQQIREILH